MPCSSFVKALDAKLHKKYAFMCWPAAHAYLVCFYRTVSLVDALISLEVLDRILMTCMRKSCGQTFVLETGSQA